MAETPPIKPGTPVINLDPIGPDAAASAKVDEKPTSAEGAETSNQNKNSSFLQRALSQMGRALAAPEAWGDRSSGEGAGGFNLMIANPLFQYFAPQPAAAGALARELIPLAKFVEVKPVIVAPGRIDTGSPQTDQAITMVRRDLVSAMEQNYQLVSKQIGFLYTGIKGVDANVLKIANKISKLPSAESFQAVEQRLKQLESQKKTEFGSASKDFEFPDTNKSVTPIQQAPSSSMLEGLVELWLAKNFLKLVTPMMALLNPVTLLAGGVAATVAGAAAIAYRARQGYIESQLAAGADPNAGIRSALPNARELQFSRNEEMRATEAKKHHHFSHTYRQKNTGRSPLEQAIKNKQSGSDYLGGGAGDDNLQVDKTSTSWNVSDYITNAGQFQTAALAGPSASKGFSFPGQSQGQSADQDQQGAFGGSTAPAGYGGLPLQTAGGRIGDVTRASARDAILSGMSGGGGGFSGSGGGRGFPGSGPGGATAYTDADGRMHSATGRGGRGGRADAADLPEAKTLSPELQSLYSDMKAGKKIDVNDPRAKALSGLSSEQLSGLGIAKGDIGSAKAMPKHSAGPSRQGYSLTQPSEAELRKAVVDSSGHGGIAGGLMKRGFTKDQALAIAANVQAESGGSTTIQDYKHSGHWGLMQWGGARYKGLKNFAEATGRDWKDKEVQLDYVRAEYTGEDAKYTGGYSEKNAYRRALDQGGSAGDMTLKFAKHVERPSDSELAKSAKGRLSNIRGAERELDSGPKLTSEQVTSEMIDKQRITRRKQKEDLFTDTLGTTTKTLGEGVQAGVERAKSAEQWVGSGTGDQKDRPSQYQGHVTIDDPRFADKSYAFGSGGAGRGSTPYGSQKLGKMERSPTWGFNKFDVGPGGQMWDPKIGKMRGNIEMHPGTGRGSRGCISVQANQFPELAGITQQLQKEWGAVYANVLPDGNVTLSKEPIFNRQGENISEKQAQDKIDKASEKQTVVSPDGVVKGSEAKKVAGGGAGADKLGTEVKTAATSLAGVLGLDGIKPGEKLPPLSYLAMRIAARRQKAAGEAETARVTAERKAYVPSSPIAGSPDVKWDAKGGVPPMPDEDRNKVSDSELITRGQEWKNTIIANSRAVDGYASESTAVGGLAGTGFVIPKVDKPLQAPRPEQYPDAKVPPGYKLGEGKKPDRKAYAGEAATMMTQSPAKDVPHASGEAPHSKYTKQYESDKTKEFNKTKKVHSETASTKAPQGGGGADGGGRSGNPSNENSSTNRNSSPGDKGSGGGSGNTDRCWICDPARPFYINKMRLIKGGESLCQWEDRADLFTFTRIGNMIDCT